MVKAKQLILATSPASVLFAITIAVSIITGHPPDLFHENSTGGFVIRSFFIAGILLATISFSPWIVSGLVYFMREKTIFGQFVKTGKPRESELNRITSWLLRPIQGIGLCLIAGERLIEFLEFGTGLGYSLQLARISLFILGSMFVAILLSVVWILDDLGLKIYSQYGDMNTAGKTVGTILPLLFGAVGIANVFRTNTPIDAIWNLTELVLALYPSYLVFAVIHDEYTRGRLRRLHDSMSLWQVEISLNRPANGSLRKLL
jgi:hypothetical protein